MRSLTEQIRRITREELEPKSLTLLVRESPADRTRFIIKECRTGNRLRHADFQRGRDRSNPTRRELSRKHPETWRADGSPLAPVRELEAP